jgi:hypothetical protein
MFGVTTRLSRGGTTFGVNQLKQRGTKSTQKQRGVESKGVQEAKNTRKKEV